MKWIIAIGAGILVGAAHLEGSFIQFVEKTAGKGTPTYLAPGLAYLVLLIAGEAVLERKLPRPVPAFVGLVIAYGVTAWYLVAQKLGKG